MIEVRHKGVLLHRKSWFDAPFVAAVVQSWLPVERLHELEFSRRGKPVAQHTRDKWLTLLRMELLLSERKPFP